MPRRWPVGTAIGRCGFWRWRADNQAWSGSSDLRICRGRGDALGRQRLSRDRASGERPCHRCPRALKLNFLAEGLNGPREMRVAPNGDIFVAETRAGRIRILRLAEQAQSLPRTRFTRAALNKPFGIAFFRAGQPANGFTSPTRNQRHSLSYQGGRYKGRGQTRNRWVAELRRRTFDQEHRLTRMIDECWCRWARQQ